MSSLQTYERASSANWAKSEALLCGFMWGGGTTVGEGGIKGALKVVHGLYFYSGTPLE